MGAHYILGTHANEELFFIIDSRWIRIALLGLLGGGEKRRLENTLMGMGSQGKNGHFGASKNDIDRAKTLQSGNHPDLGRDRNIINTILAFKNASTIAET